MTVPRYFCGFANKSRRYDPRLAADGRWEAGMAWHTHRYGRGTKGIMREEEEARGHPSVSLTVWLPPPRPLPLPRLYRKREQQFASTALKISTRAVFRTHTAVFAYHHQLLVGRQDIDISRKFLSYLSWTKTPPENTQDIFPVCPEA